MIRTDVVRFCEKTQTANSPLRAQNHCKGWWIGRTVTKASDKTRPDPGTFTLETRRQIAVKRQFPDITVPLFTFDHRDSSP